MTSGKRRFGVKSMQDNLICLVLTRENLEKVIGKLDVIHT